MDGKPGKIRCAKPPKAPKPTKPPKAADCAKFDNFDAESVDIVECTDKRCTFACKEGFHTITADTAKCRSAGYRKIADGQETVSYQFYILTRLLYCCNSITNLRKSPFFRSDVLLTIMSGSTSGKKMKSILNHHSNAIPN